MFGWNPEVPRSNESVEAVIESTRHSLQHFLFETLGPSFNFRFIPFLSKKKLYLKLLPMIPHIAFEALCCGSRNFWNLIGFVPGPGGVGPFLPGPFREPHILITASHIRNPKSEMMDATLSTNLTCVKCGKHVSLIGSFNDLMRIHQTKKWPVASQLFRVRKETIPQLFVYITQPKWMPLDSQKNINYESSCHESSLPSNTNKVLCIYIIFIYSIYILCIYIYVSYPGFLTVGCFTGLKKKSGSQVTC